MSDYSEKIKDQYGFTQAEYDYWWDLCYNRNFWFYPTDLQTYLTPYYEQLGKGYVDIFKDLIANWVKEQKG